nr:DMT family transporter [Ardenticatena sp.]
MHTQTSRRRPPFPPMAALLVGVVAVSTGAIFIRLADEAPALVIAAYRVGLAVLILLPLAWWRARDELRQLSWQAIRPALLAGIFLAIHFITWVSSLDYTTVASSVVLVNTNPLWVALLTPFVSHDRLSRRAVIGIIVSVIGGIIIGAGDFAIGGQALWGDLLAILGSISAALYILMGRRLRQHLSLMAYVTLCYGAAAVVLWGLVLALGYPITGYHPATYGWFLAMALIPQLIGHSAYNWALEWFSAGVIAVSLLGEPIGSTLLAYFILGEAVTLPKILGGAFILCGIYIVTRAEPDEIVEEIAHAQGVE